MRNNLHVFLGATVADAAARPLHWVYDQKKLLTYIKGKKDFIASFSYNDADTEEILNQAEKLESDSIQLLSFTSLIKKETLEIKTEVMEHLWKIIISDKSIDQYESSLMRRICGLIYFPDKLSGDIKIKILNTK